MKKIISGVLSFAMAVSMIVGLSGCGKNETGGTLIWYMVGDKPAAHDEVIAKANEIIEPELGMKLDLRYIDGASYAEKMKLIMASGEAYDLCFTGYTNPYQTAVELGGLYDITELVEEVKLNEAVEQFYLDSAKVKGKIYGVPNIQIISNPDCMAAFPSVIEAAGIGDTYQQIKDMASLKMSYADLEKMFGLYTDMFAQLKAKKPELTTVTIPAGNLATFTNYETLYNLAIRRDGTDNKLYIEHETEEWKLGCKTVREWYKAGYIRNDVASNPIDTNVKEERVKVGFSKETWKPYDENGQIVKYGEQFDSALFSEPYVKRTSSLLTMISVGANTKHPKEAVEFIKLINENAELYNILIWGIEGKHYTKNEDGTIKQIKDSGYDEIGNNGWKYGNQFNSFVLEGEPLDKWEQYEKMNNEAVKSPLLGFVPDTTGISTEVANCGSVTAEYKAKIYFGTEDFDAWYPEFCAKMEQAGIKKVQEELQKQFDEFLASK